MEHTILEIIAKINKQKKAANRHPHFAMLKEIKKELLLQLEVELELMIESKKLKQGDVVNDLYYI